jgi:hypothetical protein
MQWEWRDLPSRQSLGRSILASKIKEVLGISSRISLGRHISSGAGIQVVLRKLDGLLKGKRVFNEGGNETRHYVPFNVAMEQPNT